MTDGRPRLAGGAIRGAPHATQGGRRVTSARHGAAGSVTIRHGQPFAITGFTIRGGKIVEMDILADPEPLAQLDLTVVDR